MRDHGKHAHYAGKPFWVSLTCQDDQAGLLRSGEPLQKALFQLMATPQQAVLINCCAPHAIANALPLVSQHFQGVHLVDAHGIAAVSSTHGNQKTAKSGIVPLHDSCFDDNGCVPLIFFVCAVFRYQHENRGIRQWF
jgi:S-methylmethionine-dependent homocysteine/selenocysteine methylase